MLAIIRITCLELIRSRIFTSLILLGGVLLASCLFLASISLGNRERMIVDYGLSMIEIMTAFIAVYLASNAFARDKEWRVWYLLFSKPLSRTDYFLWKFFATSLVVTLMWLALSLCLMGLVWYEGGAFPDLMVGALLTSLLSVLIVLALTLLVAVNASPLTSLIAGAGLYIGSMLIIALLDMVLRLKMFAFVPLAKALTAILPPLHALNLKPLLFTGATIGSEPLSYATLSIACTHALVYLALIIALWAYAFHRKSFDTV